MSESFVTPWAMAHQALLSMEFYRQEYWSGLPFPSPGGLLHCRQILYWLSHLERINSRISEVEEQISELEVTMVKIISEEQNKLKWMKGTNDSLRDLWDNIKCTNIWIIGVPEEEEEKKEWENFWRDYSWKFPQRGKGNSQSRSRGTKSPI